jgi:hypothetical protein
MKNLVAFCQTSSWLSCYESPSDPLKEISKEASQHIGELEAEFGGAWRALEENSPRAIINFLEPIVSNLSTSERQELAFDVIFSDSSSHDVPLDAWHYFERRNNFFFEILDSTFSYERSLSMFQELREYLAQESDSTINSILKNERFISVADLAINHASMFATGIFDPGFDLVRKGAHGLSHLLEPKNIEELIDLVSVSILRALFLEEAGIKGTWNALATNSADQILKLSRKNIQGRNSKFILVWLSALSISKGKFAFDDEDFLPDEVPNLLGMRLSEAEILCEAFEIKVFIESNEKTILNKKFWKVCDTSPSPGTTFKKRRQVTLEVSK